MYEVIRSIHTSYFLIWPALRIEQRSPSRKLMPEFEPFIVAGFIVFILAMKSILMY